MTDLLILNFDSDFSDSSGSGNSPVSVSGFTIVSGQASGTAGSEIRLSVSTDFLVEKTDFTVEFDVNMTAGYADLYYIKSALDVGIGLEYSSLWLWTNDGTDLVYWIEYYHPTTGQVVYENSASPILSALVPNVWQHIKIDKTLTDVKIYVNAVLVVTVTTPTDFSLKGYVHTHLIYYDVPAIIDNFTVVANIVLVPTTVNFHDLICPFVFLSAINHDLETTNSVFNSHYLFIGETAVNFNAHDLDIVSVSETMTVHNLEISLQSDNITVGFHDLICPMINTNSVVIDIHNPELPMYGNY